MKSRKRKSRSTERKKISSEQMLEPLEIEKFGSEDDPCFGKLHDLKAAECRRCGDSEICAIAMSHKGIAMRQKLEMKQEFKDMEDTEIDLLERKIYKFIAKRIEKGKSLKGSCKKASVKYSIPIERVKEIYESEQKRKELT